MFPPISWGHPGALWSLPWATFANQNQNKSCPNKYSHCVHLQPELATDCCFIFVQYNKLNHYTMNRMNSEMISTFNQILVFDLVQFSGNVLNGTSVEMLLNFLSVCLVLFPRLSLCSSSVSVQQRALKRFVFMALWAVWSKTTSLFCCCCCSLPSQTDSAIKVCISKTLFVFQVLPWRAKPTSVLCQRSERRPSTPRPLAPWVCVNKCSLRLV